MKEILLDNRNGNVWDISELIVSMSYKTSRIGKPSDLSLTCLKKGIYQSPAFGYNNGDVIRFKLDDVNVFYGYIFKVSSGPDAEVKITAYDQMRYLNYNDTYVFKNTSATEIIRRIASDFQLSIGTLADTGYKVPSLVEDDKKLLDIICKALDSTLIATTRNYVFYDDFGKLTLRNIEEMKADVILGDFSLMTDYDYERSIDGETYNRIKLVQDNKESKARDVYVAQDSANIVRWGRLQLFKKMEDKMNSAQIQEVLNNLIAVKNREQRTIQVTAIGDIRLRAGCFVPIVIKELGIRQYFLVDECTHKFEGGDHTMTLDLKVI
ncbi:hypothetical protein ABND73_15435 [Paenibacillus larvae]